MKAYEAPVRVTREGHLELPEEIARLLKPGLSARFLLLVEEAGDRAEAQAWSKLSQEQFLAGYSEADAVYDTLD
ncbi:MAG: hypothetical protein M3498_07300 [Deinococcota bacterium]|jgi:hypothetical protein|nr:hypothetical protein [Deinococcota bacterium]